MCSTVLGVADNGDKFSSSTVRLVPVGADNDAPGPGAEPKAATPSPARSRNMAAIRRTDTRPELLLRSALHARGLRFRKDYAVRAEGRIIRPDVAFTRYRVAVFLDGCFWHGCPEHGRPPKSNNSYWLPKLAKNAQRDVEQTQILTEAGWTVIRLWEHVAIGDAVSAVCDALREAGAPP
jgi:DNA mismatch endonuclease, patch repair protein